jgi:hypothetical protein
MKQLMRLAFVGLLAVTTVAYADGGKRKAKAKQQCPVNCNKSQCNKKACAQMPGCTKATCNNKG